MHVVFAGRLVCSVNMLYMELSYTGSLDQSTRASEHVTVQISCACKTTAGYHTFLKFIKLSYTVMSVFSLLCLWSLLLVCSVNMLYMELSYTGSLNWSTRAQGMS